MNVEMSQDDILSIRQLGEGINFYSKDGLTPEHITLINRLCDIGSIAMLGEWVK